MRGGGIGPDFGMRPRRGLRRSARAGRLGRGEAPQRPLCVLLLPGRADREGPLQERIEDLQRAPGTVAVEPAALGYGAMGRLPALVRERIAAGQARRMVLPGRPRAVVAFAPSQYPLARALLGVHLDAELWYADPGVAAPDRWRDEHAAARARAALTFDPFAGEQPLRERNRALYERMEALGIESGRLGSERG